MNINEKLQVIIDKQLKQINEKIRSLNAHGPGKRYDDIGNQIRAELKKEIEIRKDTIADLQWIKGNINEQSK